MDLLNSSNCEGIDNNTLLSFRNKGLFTDVKFLVNGREFKAHKIVLASRSDVFLAMFSSDMAESQNHVTVNIDDIDDEVFTNFLDYMYSLDESLVRSRPIELLLCADKYNVKPLLSACDVYFASTISESNIFDYLDLAETFHREKIKGSAIDFLRNNIFTMVHDLDSWSRLKNRFDTITRLIGSYSKFIDFREYVLKPEFWANHNLNDGYVLNGSLTVQSGTKTHSFIVELEHDARGECLLGIIHLAGEYSTSVNVYVLLEIESNNEVLLHDKLLLRWSKMCSVDTSMDMECWRLVDDNPLPCMNTGPFIFMLPNARIFDQTMNLKIGLSSLSPQYSSDSSMELVAPSELPLSDLNKLLLDSDTGSFQSYFGLKSKFDFQWIECCPSLNYDNAPSKLCEMAKNLHENDNELSKRKILQFMKFHINDIIKSDEWSILQSHPDLLRDLLVEISQ